MGTADNIKKLREQYGLTQSELGQIAGVTDKAVSTWERGDAEPRMGAIEKMAKHFGISKSQLIDDIDTNTARTYPTIPVLGTIAAGEPILMSDHEIDRIPLYPNFETGMFALIVTGDSMAPRIQDGDMVVAVSQNDVENGEIAVVAVNGDEATCKRIYKTTDTITLVGDNATAYPPHSYGPEDDPVMILGKVVEVRAKVR